MSLIVKSVPVEMFVKQCREYIYQIDMEINNLINSKKKLIWSGSVYEKVVIKYYQKIEKLKEISKKLSLFIDIFELVIKNYGESRDAIVKKLNELKEDSYGNH